jgi:hypothetical protein
MCCPQAAVADKAGGMSTEGACMLCMLGMLITLLKASHIMSQVIVITADAAPPLFLVSTVALMPQAAVEIPEEPAEGSEGVLTVAFRLPSGSRLSRRFSTSDSVAVMAAYAVQQMAANGELPKGKRVVLSTQFPKKILEDGEQQLEAAGVEDRSILTVTVS